MDELVGGGAECRVVDAFSIARADPFLAYLHGVLLRASGAPKEESRDALLAAACAWPLNWSAWIDVADLCDSATAVEAAAAAAEAAMGDGGGGGGGWPVALFRAHGFLATHSRAAALRAVGPISAIFPDAPALKSLVARALYGLRKLDAAQGLLESLRADDPARIEDADTLSNILYVQGARAPLASLATALWNLDRFRPETSLVVGNFYSLRGEHGKAAAAFRRALRADPACVDPCFVATRRRSRERD